MARKRFQAGHVRLRGKRDPYWEGFYREDVLLRDGRVVRKQCTKNLGRQADIPTKRLAQRRLADIVKELNEEDYRPRPVVTVGDFVEQKYSKLTMPTKKDTTRHSYQVILRKHVLPEIGDRQLTDLTGEDIQELVNRKVAGGLSWSTVRNIKWVLSAVFKVAVKHNYCRSNPARLVDLPPEPVRKLQQLASDEDLNRLEDALEEPFRTLVWLGRITGLRPSELFALRRSSLERKRRRIWVVEAINNGKSHSPKSHRSRRPIQLDEEQWERLEAFLRFDPDAKQDDWLFPNRRGTGPLRADNVLERVIRPKVKELGLPRITRTGPPPHHPAPSSPLEPHDDGRRGGSGEGGAGAAGAFPFRHHDETLLARVRPSAHRGSPGNLTAIEAKS
jgi:integrase